MNSIHQSPFRSYRPTVKPQLVTFQVVIEESDLWVAARSDLSLPMSELVRTLRGQIQSYAAIYPKFLTSLRPLPVDLRAPEIIQRMCRAATLCDVGPMATVAGTIAQMVAEKLQHQSPDLLIENGGDTYLYSTRDRHIGILAVPEQGTRLCVPVAAAEFPCSFCASSAKIGHSLSFGQADLVVTRSCDASLADAAATALANQLQTPADLGNVLALAQMWETIGLDGVLAQCAGEIGVWGKMELAVL